MTRAANSTATTVRINAADTIFQSKLHHTLMPSAHFYFTLRPIGLDKRYLWHNKLSRLYDERMLKDRASLRPLFMSQ